jgi:hypothetical protein
MTNPGSGNAAPDCTAQAEKSGGGRYLTRIGIKYLVIPSGYKVPTIPAHVEEEEDEAVRIVIGNRKNRTFTLER